jgi:hypothetical protein
MLLCAPAAGLAQFAQGQAFSGAMLPAAMAGDPYGASAPDSSLYSEGTRAINEGRWTDAISIFSNVAKQQSDHADGALYWKAYAENKQGQARHALETCTQLRQSFPKSRWLDECGALEIEIRARNGKPIQPNAEQDDYLRLLALNALMRQDEPRALAQIQEILNGDSSQKLKDGAIFILGQHHSDDTYDQIVRISYVEGDVRIARGKEAEHATGAVWEKAVANLPLEAGFSLVTGEGRAEIEFENASTLYLAENSVLTFNDMHTTAGIPYTELALLSGAASVNIRPYVAGEIFLLRTPTDDFSVDYPHKFTARIGSYVDAATITPLDPHGLSLPQSTTRMLAMGQTLTMREGRTVESAETVDPHAFAAWDKWVADRIAQRDAAVAEVMKASGLSEPIPGMAAMAGQGTFFDCAPYGTCWEPPSPAAERQARGGGPADDSQVSSSTGLQKPAAAAVPARSSALRNTGPGAPLDDAYADDLFLCPPLALRYQLYRNSQTGPMAAIDSTFNPYPYPYQWAVCHTGSWIHRNHRYVWVAGHRRHHLEAVRWVKSGHTVAYVPIHPYDVKGRPPLNRKEEVFAVNRSNGLTIERVKLDPDRPIEMLNTPPREFRAAFVPPLPRASEPRLAVHPMKDVFASKGNLARAAGIPLSFDHKSQTFMMARQGMQGNHGSTTSFAPITNRSGNLQGGTSGFSGGGYRGGSGGTYGGSSGARAGGGSSSGGSHSGASASSSSSSSSTSSVSTSSVSSSGSSGSSAGSSGGHH